MTALPLREYQEAFCKAYLLASTSYGALDAGLGKTLCAIRIAQELGAKRILVVCPASVKLAWIAELKKWNPSAKFHAPVKPGDVGWFHTHPNTPLWTIVNYDKLSRGDLFIAKLVEHGPYDLLILDEAHAVKELTSKRTRAVFRSLAPISKKILPLSATPMTRSASDLYTPLRFLKPEAITNKHGHIMTLHEFQDRYCQVEMKRVGPRLVREVKGSRNMPELKERMGDFFYRLKKADVLPELPPMQFVEMPLGLHADAYAPILEAAKLIDMDDEDIINNAVGNEHIARAMRMIGEAKAIPAVQYITDYLEDNDLKCVVWCKHHSVIDAVAKGLMQFNPVGIDGRMNQTERGHAVDTFLNSPTCRVFIGQINAAGTGLTLLNEHTQPRDVFFVEQDWSPSQNYQSASRVHRMGMRDGVLCRVFTAQGVDLDQRLQSVLTRKMSEFEQLI